MIKIFAIALVLVFTACSGAPKQDETSPPAWTHQPTRTVDSGYIVYVGSGEDRSPDKARFKAEAMALQDLSNECSFAPKGTRIEDHFDDTSGLIHRSYAKVAVEFQDCENAKQATSPEQIRELANVQFTDEIKRYQDLVDEPEPAESAPLEVASNSDSSQRSTASSFQANGQASGPGGSAGSMGPSSMGFFVYREQVVFVKQDIITAPPAVYPPQAPQTTQPVPSLVVASNSIHQYEQANPAVAKSSQAFSTSRPNWYNHQASALRETRAERARINAKYPRTNHFSSGGSQKQKKSKRRRRSWNNGA